MKCDYLIRAIGCIDGALIDEAEDYKPTRKNHAWIWAAVSAACLCFAIPIVFSLCDNGIISTGENCLIYPLAAVPVHGYVDYRETAEKGKVMITDELKAQLDECNEQPVLFGNREYGYIFPVHITEAEDVSRYHLYSVCLEPLKLGESEIEDFLRDGTLMLTKEQIYSLKCPPECTVIIAPSMIDLNADFLETVTLDTLNVRVYTHSRDQAPDGDPSDQDAWNREIKRIKDFFDKYAEDNEIPRESIKEYYESTGNFTAELDKETIARLLADERTEKVCMITDG